MLGSSGVGKSTLVNTLAGADLLETKEIRDDGKGRHTTTRRELIQLPGGGLIIDTPGMRELQLWAADEGLEETFEDVTSLFAHCRFSDCAHDAEPGCAVKAAIADGTLPRERWESYLKLQAELEHLERRVDKRAASEAKKRWKALSAEGKAQHARQDGDRSAATSELHARGGATCESPRSAGPTGARRSGSSHGSGRRDVRRAGRRRRRECPVRCRVVRVGAVREP